jgi:rhodanese-related sulfurtransferase
MLGLFKKTEEVNYKDLFEDGAVILDVRSKEEFEGGHIKGALSIPLDELSLNFNKLRDKKKCIIICCMSGGRSSIAKNMLHQAGYENVYNGGGWQSLQGKLYN